MLGAAALLAMLSHHAGAAELRVTSAGDHGDGSLRAAITKAHGGDRIVLALSGNASVTIALLEPLPPLPPGTAIELRAGSANVTIAGGALPLGAKGGLAVEVAAGKTIVLDTEITGPAGRGTGLAVAGRGTGLAVAGGGTLVLKRPCDYAGGTAVTEGTLKLDGDGTLPAKGRLTLSGARFTLGPRDAAVGGLAGEGAAIVLGDAALTVDQDDDSRFQGSIAGAGRFIKAGAGKLALETRVGWTGGIEVTGGVLELAGSAPGQTVQLRGPIIVRGGALVTPGMRLGAQPNTESSAPAR
jgi:hypothetical protein